MKQFHISRNARDLYQFDQSLFKTDGNVIFTNFEAVKLFAQKMNKRRDLLHHDRVDPCKRSSDLCQAALVGAH